MTLLKMINVNTVATNLVISDRRIIEENHSSFLSDESNFRGDAALSLSFPTSREQVVAIITDHFNLDEPTTISGTRSGVVGFSVPVNTPSEIETMKALKNSLTLKDYFPPGVLLD